MEVETFSPLWFLVVIAGSVVGAAIGLVLFHGVIKRILDKVLYDE